MLSHKMKIIKILYNNSPEYILRRVKSIIKGKRNFDYSLDSVLIARKHMDYVHLIDRWERYWRVIEGNTSDVSRKGFNFKDRSVFELGCGPLLGWGSMALFLGASRYYYDEPELQREVVESEKIKGMYFSNFYHELVSNYGNTLDFEAFYSKMLTECNPLNLDDDIPGSSKDIILSNSVLEHISRNDITCTFERLYKILRADGYFLHCVDFSSHGIGRGAFGNMYNKPKKDTGTGILNLMRLSEIEMALTNTGFKCEHVVYRQADVDKNDIGPSWEKYSEEDLTSSVVLFLGEK